MAFTTTDKSIPVKMVIKGKSYNSATSQLVHHSYGDSEPFYLNGDEYYSGEAELYKNRYGIWFFLYRDCHVSYGNGEEEFINKISPCTPDEALVFLERYAQEKIDDHFNVLEIGSTEVRVSLRMTSSINVQLKRIAESKKMSLNRWLMIVIINAIKEENKSDVK